MGPNSRVKLITYIPVKAGKLLPKADILWISQNCYRQLCVGYLTTEANIVRVLNKTKALKAALWGLTRLGNLMEASLKTAPEKRTSLEGSPSRDLSSSGISYLDNIIIFAYELSV